MRSSSRYVFQWWSVVKYYSAGKILLCKILLQNIKKYYSSGTPTSLPMTTAELYYNQLMGWVDNDNNKKKRNSFTFSSMLWFDHNMMLVLKVVGSDYINANYCDGYRKQNAYIATQVSLLWRWWWQLWGFCGTTRLLMLPWNNSNCIAS